MVRAICPAAVDLRNASGFTVRPAVTTDVGDVNRIQADAGRSRFSAEAWSHAANGDHGAVVAEFDDRIIGWASTRFYAEGDGPAGAGQYLAGLTVHPRSRRRGVARALVAARLGWIAERADTAWYFANARNIASIAAHAEFGFVELGRAHAFHGVSFSGGEGIVFRADLSGAAG